MCLYHYVYFSRCQHAELTKVTFCDRANALRLPEQVSRYQPSTGSRSTQVRETESLLYEQSSSSFARHSDPSHSHTVQHHHNMSTRLPPAPRMPLEMEPNTSPQNVQQLPHTDLIDWPLHEGEETVDHGVAFTPATTSFDTLRYRNFNIDIPLDTKSTLSMEVTHDGKVTELVARFESFSGLTGSDTTEASHTDDSFDEASSTSTIIPGHDDSSSTHNDAFSKASLPIPDRLGSDSHSPRKPIPSEWLTKNRGPNLRTAQRARERGTKRTQSESPRGHRMSRGQDVSGDSNASNTLEGTTFLTKDAAAAVESDITSPTHIHTSHRLRHSTSRAALGSSGGSPVKSSPRRQPIPPKSSPTRSTFLNTGSRHTRAPSSIISSAGGEAFHTADNSPRSSVSGQSFKSSYGNIPMTTSDDDISIPHLDEANSDQYEGPENDTLSHDRLPKIPESDRKAAKSKTTAQKVTAQTLPVVSNVGITAPHSSSSRIPRRSTGTKSASADTLKQSKSKNLLKEINIEPRPKDNDINTKESKGMTLPGSSVLLKKSHDISLGSSEPSIALLSSKFKELELDDDQEEPHSEVEKYVNTVAVNKNNDQTISLSQGSPMMAGEESVDSNRREHLADFLARESSRATSSSTVQIFLGDEDPSLHDSAILYSRRKLDSIGCEHHEYVYQPDDSNLKRSQNEHQSTSMQTNAQNTRSDNLRFHSDLRATAPEFVPQNQSELHRSRSMPEDEGAQTSSLALDPYALDMYGIPWFYQMYPVPFLFPPKPFRKRWSKSPRKARNRNQGARPNVSDQNQQQGSSQASSTLEEVASTSKRPRDKSPESIPFLSQIDVIARQAASQDTHASNHFGGNLDLTAIRNVGLSEGPYNSRFHTMPRRQNTRYSGNGLYGGRAAAGIPIQATAPFPDPLPPMGPRPRGHTNEGYLMDYGRFTLGQHNVCGIIDIDQAKEVGGGPMCNKCDPDH